MNKESVRLYLVLVEGRGNTDTFYPRLDDLEQEFLLLARRTTSWPVHTIHCCMIQPVIQVHAGCGGMYT